MTTKKRILSEHIVEPPPGLWSNCLAVGPVVYIAGLTAFDIGEMKTLASDEYQQARVIFQHMRALLTAAGGTIDDIVKLTIFLTDVSKNTDVWRARQEFFTGDFPVCSLVEVKALTRPDLLVEIEGIAHIGSSAKPSAS